MVAQIPANLRACIVEYKPQLTAHPNTLKKNSHNFFKRMPFYQEPMPYNTEPHLPRAMKRKLDRQMKQKKKKLASLKPDSKVRKQLEKDVADLLCLRNPDLAAAVNFNLGEKRIAELMKFGRTRHPNDIEVSHMFHQSGNHARALKEAISGDLTPTASTPSPQPADPLPPRKSKTCHLSPDNEEEFMSEMEEILGSLWRDIPSFP